MLHTAFSIPDAVDPPKVDIVYSEITGRPVGKTVETNDSRSATIVPPTVRIGPEQLEQWFGSLNEFRKRIYESERRKMGYTHDEAVRVLFPNRKVLA